ncbi:hypothetical protein G9E11_01780 [Arthrobacter sp. IA7]|nr:hypothetical protein [Arthrobacter ipis]MBD1541003.1 hypothetical protein [Arthrobacter ipis]
MKLVGVIPTKETSTIEVEAASYQEGLAALEAKIPEGYQLLSIRTEKG